MIRPSLKAKLIMYNALILVIFVPVIAWISLSYFQARFQATIKAQQFVLVSRLADEIDNRLTYAHHSIIQVASQVPPEIVKDPVRAGTFLRNRIGLLSLFDNGLFFISPQGKILAETGTDPPRLGFDLSFRDYVKKTIATRKPVISEPFVSTEKHHHPIIMLTAPVVNAKGELIAIMGGSLDLLKPNVIGNIADTMIGATGYIYLATEERTLISYRDRSRIMTRFPEGENILLEKAVQGFEGSDRGKAPDGTPILASFKRIKTTNWIVAVNLPEKEAFAPVKKATQFAWIIVAAGTLLATIGVWLAMNRLISPLQSITSQMKAGTGKPLASRQIVIKTKDEIFDFAKAYNNLMKTLAEREHELVLERDQAQNYLRVAGVLIAALDDKGNIRIINAKGCEILGFDHDEIVGKNWFDTCIAAGRREEFHRFHRQLMAGDAKLVEYYENEVVTKTGELRILSFHNSILHDEDGVISGVLFSGEDITERKEAEEAVRTLNAELEQRVQERTAQLKAVNETLMQEINQRRNAQNEVNWLNEDLLHQKRALEAANWELESFCYSVSHDLRAPLRHICGYITALNEDLGKQLDESAVNYLDRINNASIRMGELIDALLNLSRYSTGQLKITDVNLSDIAHEIATRLTATAPERNVAWTIQDSIIHRGDGTLLMVVMENLLGNAWKYTGKQEKTTITFGKTMKKGEPVCFVKDDGAGFDMRYADKLFGAFQRLHQVDEYEGTGIGLATVQRIIHRHGGQIWAEGEVGKGAVFYFTLP